MQLNVYLSFPGNAEEALTFYQSVLGGEIIAMMPFTGSPMAGCYGADWDDKVMHAGLVTGNLELMACDLPPSQYQTPQGMHVSINVDDTAEAERVYGALSEGGEVQMPLDETFWADRFGMFTDKFGINWMINCESSKRPSA